MHLELMRKKDKVFGEIEDPESYLSARIWHCKYSSLEPISKLRNLKTLVIATYPDSTFGFLSDLKNLRYLRILHMPKISSLKGLDSIESLEYLSLSTLPSWDASGKVTEVESLAPLSNLHELRMIELCGVRPVCKKLGDLEGCVSLKSARFNRYPESEVEFITARMGLDHQCISEPEYAKL